MFRYNECKMFINYVLFSFISQTWLTMRVSSVTLTGHLILILNAVITASIMAHACQILCCSRCCYHCSGASEDAGFHPSRLAGRDGWSRRHRGEQERYRISECKGIPSNTECEIRIELVSKGLICCCYHFDNLQVMAAIVEWHFAEYDNDLFVVY